MPRLNRGIFVRLNLRWSTIPPLPLALVDYSAVAS